MMAMRRLAFIILALVVFVAANAQSTKELYEEGKALYEAKNYEAAFPKLKKAAEKGKKGAQYRLARCYDKGHGVEEDNAQAVKWYQKAAAQGYAKAQYQLGKAYLKGKKGLKADRKKAKSLLSKAVRNEKDGDKILSKLRKDAASGDEEAKEILKLLNK